MSHELPLKPKLEYLRKQAIQKGCKTDLLMAASLGNYELVREHLERDAGCIYMTVSDEWFPMRDPRAGGTIYVWQLGRNRTAHTVARDFGTVRLLLQAGAIVPPDAEGLEPSDSVLELLP